MVMIFALHLCGAKGRELSSHSVAVTFLPVGANFYPFIFWLGIADVGEVAGLTRTPRFEFPKAGVEVIWMLTLQT